MDRSNRVGRRERCEILKIAQALGEGTVAVDKGSSREGRIWPAFLDQFWIGRRVDGTDANVADDPQP